LADGFNSVYRCLLKNFPTLSSITGYTDKMSEAKNTIRMLKALWLVLSSERKRQFKLLIPLMLVSAVTEAMSLGALLPFLGFIADPNWLFESVYIKPLVEYFGLTHPEQLLGPVTLVFLLAVMLTGVARLMLLWHTTQFSFLAASDLSIEIYRRTLLQPYETHLNRNSSIVLAGVTTNTSQVTHHVLLPVLNIITALLVVTGVLSLILIVNPIIACVTFGGFGLIYLSVVLVTRMRLKRNSIDVLSSNNAIFKNIQEGLAGIRDILLDRTQATHVKFYAKLDQRLRRAQASNQFLGLFPRYGVETLGLILITLTVYIMLSGDNSSSIVPLIGVLALGAQRLMPIIQQAYNGWSAISSEESTLNQVIGLLNHPAETRVATNTLYSLGFNDSVKLVGASFAYRSSNKTIIKDANLTIKKGSCVGIIGETGSGKSTLLDLLMGLLEPSKGSLLVDDQVIDVHNRNAWYKYVAHVPQSIFIADATIAENVALGISLENIDFLQLEESVRLAQLKGFIEGLPKGYHTNVGERGTRLSGGQRQRLGIARALYKKAEFIIFDEATSALDNDTESKVIEAIQTAERGITKVLVAHRITSLRFCDAIFEVKNNGVSLIGNYNDLVVFRG